MKEIYTTKCPNCGRRVWHLNTDEIIDCTKCGEPFDVWGHNSKTTKKLNRKLGNE